MRFLAALALLVAIAAYATRPDAVALDEMIVGDLQVEASNLGIGEGDNLVSGLAKLTCSLNPAECARLIRSAMTIEVSDLYVARTATVSFGDEPALDCIGAFTRWTCTPIE